MTFAGGQQCWLGYSYMYNLLYLYDFCTILTKEPNINVVILIYCHSIKLKTFFSLFFSFLFTLLSWFKSLILSHALLKLHK